MRVRVGKRDAVLDFVGIHSSLGGGVRLRGGDPGGGEGQ